jgi:hypothetical protein
MSFLACNENWWKMAPAMKTGGRWANIVFLV